MENKVYKFDKLFLLEEIKKAEDILKDDNITFKEKLQLGVMWLKFNKYLGSDNSDEKEMDKVKKVKKEELYKNLETKLNNDLNIIDIEFWREMKILYNNIDHSRFEKNNYNNINIGDTSMLNLILDFYESIDEEYYSKALQIIQVPTSLINFDNCSKTGDECFKCLYLNVPFINVKTDGDAKYIVFIHELQHGIDFLINHLKVFYLYRELAPIFFETIFTDVLYSLYSSERLYSCRINSNMTIMKALNVYIDTLLLFDKQGRKVTKDNVNDLLKVRNKNQLFFMYNNFMKLNFVDEYSYALSFFRSIQLREEYNKNDRKEVIRELKDCVSGKNIGVDFNSLASSYNKYIEEIKTKQKRFQGNVKL